MSRAPPEPDFRRVISNLLIEGNLLRESTERSGLIVAMGDERGLGNVVDGVTVRNNVFTGNNHLGATILGQTRNVTVLHNTFHENGLAGLYLGAGVDGVDVAGNLFVQSANAVCQSNCSWYPLAHVIAEAGVGNLRIDHDHYAPGAPLLVGATAAHPTAGAVTLTDPLHLDFRLGAGSGGIDTIPLFAGAPVDAEGVQRPVGTAADAGAYEFVLP